MVRRIGMVPRFLGAAMALTVAGCATLPKGADRDTRQLYAGLKSCGIDTRPATLRYTPQDSLITLIGPQTSRPRQTSCLARLMIDRGLELKSGDLGYAEAYAAALRRENALVGARMARLWLKRNHKGAVPDYAPARESLGDYVRKLERICDAPPGSIEVSATAVLIPWLEGQRDANERVSCVYLAALASNLGAAGIKVVSLPGK